MALINAFDNEAYSSNVIIGSAGLAIDRYYGYYLGSTPVAARIPELIKIHTNAVHPATEGYEQMSDVTFAEILYLINE